MQKNVKATRAIAVCGVLCALGVILMALGSLIQVLDLTVAVVASLLVIFAVIELGGRYPYLVYAVTAVLSVLLVPAKTAPMVYLCFAGYYPIIKAVLERRFSRPVCWALKLLAFNVGLALSLFVLFKLLAVFTVPAVWYYALLPLCSVVFVFYDIALTRLITVYLTKWSHRFRFLHKQ